MIRGEIARRGAISFRRFMELALYHPAAGYYERAGERLGRAGDYYTSVSVGAVFGDLLAFQFAGWARAAGGEAWQILEAGAHDGRLAADVLGGLAQREPDALERLEYWILEPSPTRRGWQAERLGTWSTRVRWFATWDELPALGVAGVIFANELLDSLPVHRLGWDSAGQRWFEWGVGLVSDEFTWVRLPWSAESARAQCQAEREDERREPRHVATPREVRSQAALPPAPSPALGAVLPEGFTVEFNPAAVAWWRRAARSLRRGHLLTLDYGLIEAECFAPARARGTLRAYAGHRQTDRLLDRPGEQDLTAHLDFTALQAAGEAEGLRTLTLTSQGQFLTGLLGQTAALPGRFPVWTPTRVRQFHTLTHPDHLGRAFRVLLQEREGCQPSALAAPRRNDPA